MGDITKIQWTDHTFNPWVGCTKVHEGCTNCYAEADMDKRRRFAEWGPSGTRVLTTDANWRKPIKWNREAEVDGVRRKVFCASLADVFEEYVQPMVSASRIRILNRDGSVLMMSDARRRLFDLIDVTPNLDWLILTKRPELIPKMWTGNRRLNVWLGASISNQSTANKLLKHLSMSRGLSPVLFGSYEPALGALDLRHLHSNLDWLIVGGESGMDARPCRQTWIRDAVVQCAEYTIPCFVKQFGANAEEGFGANRKIRLIDKKGGDPAEWPEDLRVRQFPTIVVA